MVSSPSKPDKKYFGIADNTFEDVSETKQEISAINMFKAVNFLSTYGIERWRNNIQHNMKYDSRSWNSQG